MFLRLLQEYKTFLPFGSYASISDLYVFPMSPPNMYQTPSMTNDFASLKSKEFILDGVIDSCIHEVFNKYSKLI